MKRKYVAIAIFAIIVISTPSIIWAYRAGPFAPYICGPFSYDMAKYSQCRVFTQNGQATIQEDSWSGHILAVLYLNGAPIGSRALWVANANVSTILVSFPNGSSVTCLGGHGPCAIGMQ